MHYFRTLFVVQENHKDSAMCSLHRQFGQELIGNKEEGWAVSSKKEEEYFVPKSNLKYVMMLSLNGTGERLWQFQVTEGTLSINGSYSKYQGHSLKHSSCKYWTHKSWFIHDDDFLSRTICGMLQVILMLPYKAARSALPHTKSKTDSRIYNERKWWKSPIWAERRSFPSHLIPPHCGGICTALWGEPYHSPTSNSAPSPSDKPCQIIVSKSFCLNCQNSCTMLKLTL